MEKQGKILQDNPFKVPESYFDEISRKIVSATSGFSSEVKKVSLYRKLRPYMAIAASLALLVIIGYAIIQFSNSDKQIASLSDINLEAFTEIWINDIDIIKLEEDAASLVLFEEGSGVDKKEIIDYLLLESIDFNDIYEQLLY